MTESIPDYSFRSVFLSRLKRERMAVAGITVIFFMVLSAIYAPLIANGIPLFCYTEGGCSFPALHSLFEPESPEVVIEKSFNYLMFFFPVLVCIFFLFRKRRLLLVLIAGVLTAIPFFGGNSGIDRTDWQQKVQMIREQGGFVLTAPIPYGPFETIAKPYEKPSRAHLLGTDHSGRDVFARLIYGARVSAAVGFAASLISIMIGTFLGLFAGYRGGKVDLYTMRLVEIVICFPQFLLLLILMSILLDYGSRQSILLVIAVIGFFGWTGLCRLVRGEVLKHRAMPYISAAESVGVSTGNILLKHLLPNVSGPILVTFSFEVAGAILAESSLSFLGFGVQDPVSSWGELMRQAFPDPVTYWHLILWPGLAIFLTVCAFNFIGEGIRKAIS